MKAARQESLRAGEIADAQCANASAVASVKDDFNVHAE
jgi:hypothetical protein